MKDETRYIIAFSGLTLTLLSIGFGLFARDFGYKTEMVLIITYVPFGIGVLITWLFLFKDKPIGKEVTK